MWIFHYAIGRIFYSKTVQTESRISSLLECSAEVQPVLFKYTEYGFKNPPHNHECELHETYQDVTAKHNYQESEQKEKHVSHFLEVLPTPFTAFR